MTDTAPSAAALEALLDDYLDGALAELDGPPAGQDQADRYLWALRSVRRRITETEAVAKARIDQVTAWRDDEVGRLNERAEYLAGLLEGWAQAQHEDTGRKTWKLPAGELRVRPRMVRAEVTWPADSEQYARNARVIEGLVPEAVDRTVNVKPGEVKKRATAGGLLEGYSCPEGYEAREAVLPAEGEDGLTVVPGVVLLVPVKGRTGKVFTAVTK